MKPAVCHPERRAVSHDLCSACNQRRLRRKRGPYVVNTKADCHPDRQHCALGLCRPCYTANKLHGLLPSSRPATCHPDRPAIKGTLCNSCGVTKNRHQRAERKSTREFRQATGQKKGRDRDGYGLCWRCRARRSCLPGIAGLICRQCQRELEGPDYERRVKASGLTYLHIHPDTPAREIVSWVWGKGDAEEEDAA